MSTFGKTCLELQDAIAGSRVTRLSVSPVDAGKMIQDFRKHLQRLETEAKVNGHRLRYLHLLHIWLLRLSIADLVPFLISAKFHDRLHCCDSCFVTIYALAGAFLT